MDAATDGDTVLVAAGTYAGEGNGDIMIRDKRIVVMSQSGPESTILDLENERCGFIVRDRESEGTVVRGFTVRRASRAFRCINTSPTISDCIIKDGHAESGTAFGFYHAPAKVMNCVISGCTAYGYQGHLVYSLSSNDVMIADCRITNCLLGSSAIGLQHSDGQILRCEIVGNRLYDFERDGGSIELHDSAFEIIDCLIANNPGECFRATSCRITIVGCTVTENSGGMSGMGAMYTRDSEVSITQSVFWSNGSHPGVTEISVRSGNLNFVCCAVDSAVVRGEGEIDYIGEQISADPMFCDPDQVNYALRADSPCLPANSPCSGLIGARGLGCEP